MLRTQLVNYKEMDISQVPPPSRQDLGAAVGDLRTLSHQVEKVLDSVSEILASISSGTSDHAPAANKFRQVGRRRATVSPNVSGKDFLKYDLPGQRSASFELDTHSPPKCLKRKPLPTTAKPPAQRRLCGLRRPTIQGSWQSGGYMPIQGQALRSSMRSMELEPNTTESSAFMYPRVAPASPSVSPSSPCFDFTFSLSNSNDESDATAASFTHSKTPSTNSFFRLTSSDTLETSWKWDESGRSSPVANKRPQTTPPATFANRRRKTSLRNILTRTPSSPHPAPAGLGPIGPIEQPFPAGETSPVETGQRSTMDWDSSDNESFSTKLRVSLGKNSLKNSKVVTMFRRNSTD